MHVTVARKLGWIDIEFFGRRQVGWLRLRRLSRDAVVHVAWAGNLCGLKISQFPSALPFQSPYVEPHGPTIFGIGLDPLLEVHRNSSTRLPIDASG
jgi:hypothetical protein